MTALWTDLPTLEEEFSNRWSGVVSAVESSVVITLFVTGLLAFTQSSASVFSRENCKKKIDFRIPELGTVLDNVP